MRAAPEATNAAFAVNIAEIIDSSAIGKFQITIFILCAACLVMDGFDVQAMGYIAPALVRDWRIPNAVLGPVFSAALAGIAIGSLFCSMIADRVGRRPVLIAGTLSFSALTLLTALAGSVRELLAIRLLAGIGLGAIMPNAMALVGEYCPSRLKVGAMMAASCGFTAGAAAGGFISAWLIPAFGWRAVFVFGGCVPLVLAMAMLLFLPESLAFLALREPRSDRIRDWLKRIDPKIRLKSATCFMVPERRRTGAPAIYLFREGRSLVTVLLWIANFMNLVNLYFLSSWVPTVVRDSGYAVTIGVLVGTAVQVGGTIGAFGNAWLIGRLGFRRALGVVFAVGSVAIGLIGQPFESLALLFVSAFIAGWCVPGGQPGVNALAAVYYPTDLRSTGIGWGLGVGRLGAIAGPILGGMLMAMKWSIRDVFLAAAAPAIVSAVTIFLLPGEISDPVRSSVEAKHDG